MQNILRELMYGAVAFNLAAAPAFCQAPPSCETPAQADAPHPVLKATISRQQFMPEFGKPANETGKSPPLRASAVKEVKRPVFLQPSVGTFAHPYQPTAAQIAEIKAAIAKYRRPAPILSQPQINSASKPLPRWGDKDCLCHKGFSLFQAHKYLEAAQAYHQAGENMLKAWGHPTTDVANALRGEAVCLSAAGQLAPARDLLKQAVEMYIRCSNGNPPKQLEDSMADLSTTYQAMGVGRTAIMVKASTARISALSRGNPTQAALEFDRLTN